MTRKVPVEEWLDQLEESSSADYDKVFARLERVESGNFGLRERWARECRS